MPVTESGDNGWIPSEEYERILELVPILCVDVLPISRSGEIGLILRKTTDETTGWCLIGGAVRRDQSLSAAAAFQIESTLEGRFSYELSDNGPLTVSQYFSTVQPGALHDPRKHAVALTYAAVLEGDPKPRRDRDGSGEPEALDFRWHSREQLDEISFGFGQDRVVREMLARIDARA